jgi:hypothetical protein
MQENIFKNNVFITFINPSSYIFVLPFESNKNILFDFTFGLFSLTELGFSNAAMKKYAKLRKERDELTFTLGNIHTHNIVNDLLEELKYFQIKKDQCIAIRAKIAVLEKRIEDETENLKATIKNMEHTYTTVSEKLDYYDSIIDTNLRSMTFELLETPITIQQYLNEKKDNDLLCELLENSFISYS